MDLTTDVYDELIRRSEESKKMPFLPTSSSFSIKRNQARQKLGTLSDKRFKDLIGDLFIDLLIRFPDLDKNFKAAIKNFPKPSERPLPPITPPSPLRSSIFDLSNIMNDILDKKNLPSYSELPTSHTPFPSGLEGVSKKYEAELAVAYRINQELENKLMNKSFNTQDSKPPSGETSQTNIERSFSVLNQDYERLQREYERTKLTLNRAQDTVAVLTTENTQLKQTLSLYEAEGNESLASQFATLQRQHAEMKHEYQVEMEGLRRRYLDLESAQSKHLSVIESIGKNNEVLEIKLSQVNRALETSQQDNSMYMKAESLFNSPSDNSQACLISNTVILQMRSATNQLLEASRKGTPEKVSLATKSIHAHAKILMETVVHFEGEVSGSKNNFRAQITQGKADFSTALSNILALTQQPKTPSTRFAEEIAKLLSSAESLQLLLQTNFCSLPYFSKSAIKASFIKASRPTKSLDAARFSSPSSLPMRTLSSPSSLLHQKSISADVLGYSHPWGDNSDDLMLEPLREYLEEQTEVIIRIIDHMMGFIRSDDFSSELADEVGAVHRKVQQMLVETKQYAAVPHLQESPRLESVLNSLRASNQRFLCLLEDLLPVVDSENPDPKDANSLTPTLRALKYRLATLAFELARHIKALVQSVS
ncbi:component of the polarisome, variant 3 [Entomophthora muscae]|nr:component of the polarisome, variant 3 [Entomophthora muscae]